MGYFPAKVGAGVRKVSRKGAKERRRRWRRGHARSQSVIWVLNNFEFEISNLKENEKREMEMELTDISTANSGGDDTREEPGREEESGDVAEPDAPTAGEENE